jgi:hypothetical protein
MKKKSWFIISLFIVALFFWIWFLNFSEPNLKLITQGQVHVYGSVDIALSPLPQQVVSELEPEQGVDVVKCVDAKHYQIYKVRLPDGKIGFINDGKYKLVPRKLAK